MSTIRVGVLRGGENDTHYVSSFQKGGDLVRALVAHLGHTIKPVDILIDREGLWHYAGVPVAPSDLVHKVDTVWNTSHPTYSMILESVGVPVIGNSSFVGALENNKALLYEHLNSNGIRMPRQIIIPVYQRDFDSNENKDSSEDEAINVYILKKAKDIWQKFSPPWIVCPASGNKGYSKKVVKTFAELVSAIAELVYAGEGILVEEFIVGKEASVHSIPDFRDESFYALPVSSISNGMFSLSGFSNEEKVLLRQESRKLHDHLGHRNYMHSIFILTARGRVYLKNIDFHPDFRDHSHFHAALDAFGIERGEVLEHMIKRSLML